MSDPSRLCAPCWPWLGKTCEISSIAQHTDRVVIVHTLEWCFTLMYNSKNVLLLCVCSLSLTGQGILQACPLGNEAADLVLALLGSSWGVLGDGVAASEVSWKNGFLSSSVQTPHVSIAKSLYKLQEAALKTFTPQASFLCYLYLSLSGHCSFSSVWQKSLQMLQ